MKLCNCQPFEASKKNVAKRTEDCFYCNGDTGPAFGCRVPELGRVTRVTLSPFPGFEHHGDLGVEHLSLGGTGISQSMAIWKMMFSPRFWGLEIGRKSLFQVGSQEISGHGYRTNYGLLVCGWKEVRWPQDLRYLWKHLFLCQDCDSKTRILCQWSSHSSLFNKCEVLQLPLVAKAGVSAHGLFQTAQLGKVGLQGLVVWNMFLSRFDTKMGIEHDFTIRNGDIMGVWPVVFLVGVIFFNVQLLKKWWWSQLARSGDYPSGNLWQFAIENCTLRWFTELKDGDFPLQILGVPEGNSGIATNIFPWRLNWDEPLSHWYFAHRWNSKKWECHELLNWVGGFKDSSFHP